MMTMISITTRLSNFTLSHKSILCPKIHLIFLRQNSNFWNKKYFVGQGDVIFTDTSKKFKVHFCVVCNMIFYAIFHAFFFYFSVLFFSIEKVRGWYNFCKAFSTCQHFYLQLGNWLKYNVIARCAQKELPDFFVHKLLHSIF